MNEDIVKTLYSQEEIKNVIARLGKEISADMKDKNPVVVCILTGAVIFMTDLVREMDIKCNLEFMDVSSYGTGTTSTGNVKIIKDLDTSVEGRNVLIVEDIVDTGKTLHRLVDLFKTRDAESVKIVTLLDKPARRTETVTPDYVGISDVPNEFVVGYGLDYQGYYRNLPYIGVLKPEIYTEN